MSKFLLKQKWFECATAVAKITCFSAASLTILVFQHEAVPIRTDKEFGKTVLFNERMYILSEEKKMVLTSDMHSSH